MAAALVLAAAGCMPDAPPNPASSALMIDTADGLRIAASLRRPHAAEAPGLVLIHQFGADRSSWETFSIRAQASGYATIAVDLRGHGDSAKLNSDAPRYRGFTRDDWEGVLLDIDAAKQALIAAGADADRIGIVGASIGANLAAWYAASHDDVRALVLISPGHDYKGVQIEPPIAAYANRPLMLVAGEGDGYSAETCRALNQAASGFREMRTFPGTYHGTELLDSSPNVGAQILQWCDTTLKNAADPGEVR